MAHAWSTYSSPDEAKPVGVAARTLLSDRYTPGSPAEALGVSSEEASGSRPVTPLRPFRPG